jgi:hypothetical protein
MQGITRTMLSTGVGGFLLFVPFVAHSQGRGRHAVAPAAVVNASEGYTTPSTQLGVIGAGDQRFSQRPPGWDRGRKVGWSGGSVPPGLAPQANREIAQGDFPWPSTVFREDANPNRIVPGDPPRGAIGVRPGQKLPDALFQTSRPGNGKHKH